MHNEIKMTQYQSLPLGITINVKRKNPDNANNPHDDTFRPKNVSKTIERI